MSSAALRLPTFDELYAEIEALPEGLTGEIMGPGELRTMSRPGAPHRYFGKRVARSLDGADLSVGGSGWWIEVEAEIQLPSERLYVPDLAGWRASGPPDFIYDNPITVVPAWVCEILSRATQRADRVRKLPYYAAAGVEHVWIVDPVARTVEVYQTVQGHPSLIAAAADGDVATLAPFDLPIDVGALWLAPRG